MYLFFSTYFCVGAQDLNLDTITFNTINNLGDSILTVYKEVQYRQLSKCVSSKSIIVSSVSVESSVFKPNL